MKKKRGGRTLPAIVSWLLARIKRIVVIVLAVWTTAIFLFSFLPVPYSGVMLQNQLSAWSQGDFKYRSQQTWVAMDDISPYMALAVIASEDQKFPQHWGFDFQAISSVIASRSRGASTISQQTAKNLFLWNGRSWLRKGLEAGLTIGIEVAWTKRRILTVYLNIAEFGEGIFGVEQAARHFFGKPAKHLTAEEAALLAAVLPNPIVFQVKRPSAYVLGRQQWILKQMRQMGGVGLVKKL